MPDVIPLKLEEEEEEEKPIQKQSSPKGDLFPDEKTRNSIEKATRPEKKISKFQRRIENPSFFQLILLNEDFATKWKI